LSAAFLPTEAKSAHVASKAYREIPNRRGGGAMTTHRPKFTDTNRHLVEVPDTFAIARWPRDADVATIARCILGTLKYEPHVADTTVLRHALEDVIERWMAEHPGTA
jgi:hypothetical protein